MTQNILKTGKYIEFKLSKFYITSQYIYNNNIFR